MSEAAAAPPPETQVPASPYKGLTHYTEEDAGFFFGRESERQIIIANLMASRLTLVYGASGVGKSSLMRAAVARRLRDLTKQDFEELGEAQFLPVVFTAWKDDPPGELLNCVRAAAESLLGKTPTVPEGRLDEQLAAVSEELNMTLLVILDQFEEYFLYHPQDAGPGTFAGDFPRAVNRRDLRVNFAISIREDALAMLDRFKGRIPNLFENYLRIDHLKRDAAREAIVKPIEEFNRLRPDEPPVEIEPELVEAVLDQIRTGAVVLGQSGHGTVDGGKRSGNGGAPGDDKIETPYLQLVMSRLWNEEMSHDSRTLRLETLERLGGAQRIVRTHLDEAMSELESDEQDAAATIFRQLVTPSGTKIAHTVPDLADYARVPPDELTPVLEHLSGGDVRILRPVAPPPGQLDGGRYEIFHDVLAPAILDWRSRYVEKKAREDAERELEESREEARREKRRARIFRAVAVVAIACAVLAAILGLFTWRQKQTAGSKARAGAAVANLAVDPAKSVGWALAALGIKHTQDAEDALRLSVSQLNERMIVKAHDAWINSVAYSPDGKRIATAAADNTVRIWDASTGKRLSTLKGHTDGVSSVAFSNDGRYIVSGSDDKTIRIWDALSGGSLVSLSMGAKVNDAVFSPDGRFVVGAAENGDLVEWRWNQGHSQIWKVRDASDAPASVAFRRDGRQLATGSDGGKVTLRNPATGAPIPHKTNNQADTITSLEYSRTGQYLLSASSDGSAEVLDLGANNGNYYDLYSVGGGATGAAFSPDENLVSVASDDGTIRVYDWHASQLLYELHGHTDAVTDVAADPKRPLIATTSGDRTLRVWQVSVGRTFRQTDTLSIGVFSPDTKRIAVGGYGSVWIAPSADPSAQLQLPHDTDASVGSVAFSPNGKRLATGVNNVLRIWDWRKQTAVKRSQPDGANILSVSYSPDGRFLATGNEDHKVRIWDLHKLKVVRTLSGHTDFVESVAFSPDGRLLASGSDDETIRLWSTKTWKKTRVLRGHRGTIWTVAFDQSSDRLVSASGDLTSRIWDLKSGKFKVLRQNGSVRAAAFTADGTAVVTGGSDGNTRVWSEKTGHLLALLREHANQVNSVATDPQGDILTASDDLTAKIYRCETCGPLPDVVRQAKRLVKELKPRKG